ncbi:MAG: hypothetical protein ACXWTS_06005 [Methylococcaceae bacterium]
MKKNNLTNSLFAVLLLTSPLVGADEKYPAADFQPEVVYQDKDYIAKDSQSEKTTKQSKNEISESSEVDTKYPAANFQPQVVYSDETYKHNESLKASASTAKTSAASEVSVTESVVPSAIKKEESKPTYLIGLVGLALVGFFLFKKQSKSSIKKTESQATFQAKGAHGLTSVARYLNKVSGTGVSRYLEKHVKSASATTGVAKYMAKQAVSAKTTNVQAATGVEKYMRDRS